VIEFVTLFLGLAAGPQAVELSASPDVAEIRLLLDHQEVAVDSEAPWEVAIDLGSGLSPHLLEAIGYDAEGRELARTDQRLNVPRPPAEARIALERDAEGNVVAARLAWESSSAARPRETRVWLDGVPIEVTDPAEISLPPQDKSQLHFLQVELEFTADVMAQAQAVFGGLYLDRSSADLTAFPVITRRRSATTSASQMTGWFQRGGNDLRVTALDRGGLDLVLVRGPGAGAAVRDLEGTISNNVASGGTGTVGVAGVGNLGSIGNSGVADASERLRRIMALEPGQRLRILTTQARMQSGHSVEMTSFAMSPEITPERGGLYWALRQDLSLPGLAPEERFADAVAVAALQAANGNRRRGVLLVLADPAQDRSRHTVAEVRSYLASIGVPLIVWRVGEPAQAAWREWGEGRDIVNFRQLQSAARDLKDALDHQRIVWLEGLFLPNEIDISPSAPIDRAGAPAGS
jgi:predicted hotdog family 3-hydroxylacyl-ACP dehydratase